MKAFIFALLLLSTSALWANAIEDMNCYSDGEIFTANSKEISFSTKKPKFSANIKAFFEKKLNVKNLKSVEFKQMNVRVSRDYLACESGDHNDFSCAGSPEEMTIEMKVNYKDEYSSGSYSVFTRAPIDNISVQSSEVNSAGFNLQTVADIRIEGEPFKLELLQLYGPQERCKI